MEDTLPWRITDAHRALPCGHPAAMTCAQFTVFTGRPPRPTRRSPGRMGVEHVAAGLAGTTCITITPEPS